MCITTFKESKSGIGGKDGLKKKPLIRKTDTPLLLSIKGSSWIGGSLDESGDGFGNDGQLDVLPGVLGQRLRHIYPLEPSVALLRP